MKRFISYFDCLGYGNFILNNEPKAHAEVMKMIFRDIELTLGKRELISDTNKSLTDLSKSEINCLNFSDTIIFWTKDDSIEALKELIEVSYQFNKQAIFYTFPVRGALLHDEIVYVSGHHKSEVGSIYNINSVFGKGVVNAHNKAESQDWAGTVIDKSIIEYFDSCGIDPENLLIDYAIKYRVPYKKECDLEDEFVLRLTKSSINRATCQSYSQLIIKNFEEHKKDTTPQGVQNKLRNTLNFLESLVSDGNEKS